VEFAAVRNTDVWRVPIDLPLVRVHRPLHPGCSGVATISSGTGTSVEATLEFMGLKGGGGRGFRTELSSKYTATSVCKEEVVPATLLVEHGATLLNGEAIAYGARYQVVDVKRHERRTQPIAPSADPCQHPPSSTPDPVPEFWATFDKTAIPPGEGDSDREGARFGTTGYVTVGVGAELGSAPLKLSVEMKRAMEAEYAVETTLTGGARYLRFPVCSAAEALPYEICWSVLP
jgi:hypothetical protein